jgi:hypothetical protein
MPEPPADAGLLNIGASPKIPVIRVKKMLYIIMVRENPLCLSSPLILE